MAHRSATAFDAQKNVTITGTLTKIRYANPHIFLTLDVKKEDSATTSVAVEAGAASVLNGLGFTQDKLKVGDIVTITGNPGRKTERWSSGRI